MIALKIKYHVSETEMEILQWLWDEKRKITSREIMDHFNGSQGKTWTKQTLNTFLTRLLKKGMLETESRGNKYLYFPTLSRKDYEKGKARELLDSMYLGSIRNFIAALSGGGKLNKEESMELRDLLDK